MQANNFTPRQLIPVLMYYVSAQFDTIKMIDDFMTKSTWSESHRALVRVGTPEQLALGAALTVVTLLCRCVLRPRGS
mgnify:CR=1 FL=1